MQQRKDLIKSRININNHIKNDLTNCLGDYLKVKKQHSHPPFHQSIVNTVKITERSPFKKSLTDWRHFYSQSKHSKPNPRVQNILFGIQNHARPLNSSFSFTKTPFSFKNINKSKPGTAAVSCRKINSSFSVSRTQRGKSAFDESITPFVLVQNIYESKVSNLDENKRAKTARIREYYQKKAQKVEHFKVYDRLQEKIRTFCEQERIQDGVNKVKEQNKNEQDEQNIKRNNENSRKMNDNEKEFMRTDRVMSRSRKDHTIYQRKSGRILMVNEYFKELKGVKISRRNVLKEYKIEGKK